MDDSSVDEVDLNFLDNESTESPRYINTRTDVSYNYNSYILNSKETFNSIQMEEVPEDSHEGENSHI